MKILATNREINFKYEIKSCIICGIVLKGTEVKSIKAGKVTLKDGFAMVEKGQLILKNVYISPYDKGNINNVNETRNRVLLAHRQEINKLVGEVSQGGFTLIPYKIGIEGKYVKVELALCRGKKLYDKRESIKQKEAKRKIEQAKKYTNV